MKEMRENKRNKTKQNKNRKLKGVWRKSFFIDFFVSFFIFAFGDISKNVCIFSIKDESKLPHHIISPEHVIC